MPLIGTICLIYAFLGTTCEFSKAIFIINYRLINHSHYLFIYLFRTCMTSLRGLVFLHAYIFPYALSCFRKCFISQQVFRVLFM